MTVIRDNAADRVDTPSVRSSSSEPATPWRGADFQAALQQAAERREPRARDSQPREPSSRQPARTERQAEAEREDDEDGVVDLSALLGPAREFQDLSASSDATGVDALAGLSRSGGEAVAIPVAASGTVGAAEIEAFAAAMEKAWLAAGGDRKSLALGLADKASPLTGLGLSRAPDGALSLTLAARPDAAPEVTKALEALRKRLEVRGLALADLFVETDDGLDPESLIRRVR
ncbi:hypothetical protein [Caulobacter hibisci]|uniref:Flagellar hook-length control protein FliK n=1 Tax=Caulobacter hibisci TaxID=2035993 RepID=A0ABS0STP5_9CAUL|nr:hypothetical protein [Caulobacter hibisci]MBI1682731.1 hypothetical protein [Caulobacter hibisci]